MLNYLQEIVDFENWKDTQLMTAGAISLWYELMSVCNHTGWKEEFSPANGLLMARTRLSSKQFQRAREVLVNSGRIYYQKAEHSSECGIYKMIPFNSKKGDRKNSESSVHCPSRGTSINLPGTSGSTSEQTSSASEMVNPEESLPNNIYKQNQLKQNQTNQKAPKAFASLLVGL